MPVSIILSALCTAIKTMRRLTHGRAVGLNSEIGECRLPAWQMTELNEYVSIRMRGRSIDGTPIIVCSMGKRSISFLYSCSVNTCRIVSLTVQQVNSYNSSVDSYT